MQTMNQTIFAEILASPAWRVLPAQMSRAVAIVDAPAQTDADGLAQAIEDTPELAALVLKNMNSAFYNHGHAVTDVKEAVVRLGFAAIRNFMAVYMTQFLLPSPDPSRGALDMPAYWQHSISTSVAADLLGAKTHYPNRFHMFTYGLMHDIGFVVLEACAPGRMDAIAAKLREGVPLLVAEKVALGGHTHADVGAWLCAQWRLADDVRYVIEYHHSPTLSPVSSDGLNLLYLANIPATRIYENAARIHLGQVSADHVVLQALGLRAADMDEVERMLPEEMETFMQRHAIP